MSCVVNGIGRHDWKRSDSSDCDSVKIMTTLTTPIFGVELFINSGSHHNARLVERIENLCEYRSDSSKAYGSFMLKVVVREKLPFGLSIEESC